MTFKLVGLAEFTSALKASAKQADAGSRMAVVSAGAAVEKAVKKKLTTSSHRKGTPTPSRPGQPPSLVTGTLRRSARTSPPTRVGTTAWQVTVGMTAVYARIHEKGGRTRYSTLPARPYFEPTIREMTANGSLAAAFRSGWERV